MPDTIWLKLAMPGTTAAAPSSPPLQVPSPAAAVSGRGRSDQMDGLTFIARLNRDAEGVHHLAGGPLAALHPAVQVPLAEGRRVLASEMDRPFAKPQEAPEIGVLARPEARVGPTHPPIVHPRVEERPAIPRIRYAQHAALQVGEHVRDHPWGCRGGPHVG